MRIMPETLARPGCRNGAAESAAGILPTGSTRPKRTAPDPGLALAGFGLEDHAERHAENRAERHAAMPGRTPTRVGTQVREPLLAA